VTVRKADEANAKALAIAYIALAEDWKALEAERDRLREALREDVSDAYNLLTQGESPTQRRQPSARRIYDRARAALAAGTEGER
jgi:hypothetical protein